MSDTTILRVHSLDKKYKRTHAVKGISFEVKRGQIFGILGPNGSGKTTTLAMLLGVLNQSEGSFDWFNNGNKTENRLKIGALLETPNFYPYLNAIDNLKIVARIKQLKNEKEAIDKALFTVGMHERAKLPFNAYSLGMKQRLAIGAALLSDPEVLVLDEPTNGLDPVGISDVRDLLKDLQKEGKTIIIASHILDEMEKVCSDIIILQQGEMKYEGSLLELTNTKEHIIVKSTEIATAKQILQKVIIDLVEEKENSLEFTSDENSRSINKLLAENGIFCEEIYSRKKSLEQVFFDFIK